MLFIDENTTGKCRNKWSINGKEKRDTELECWRLMFIRYIIKMQSADFMEHQTQKKNLPYTPEGKRRDNWGTCNADWI